MRRALMVATPRWLACRACSDENRCYQRDMIAKVKGLFADGSAPDTAGSAVLYGDNVPISGQAINVI